MTMLKHRKSFADRIRGEGRFSAPLMPAKLPVDDVPRGFPAIAEIREVTSFGQLPLSKKSKKTLLVEDFEHGSLHPYVCEKHNATFENDIKAGAGLKGKALRVHYLLDPVQHEFRAVDIAMKFILKEGLQDWSHYSSLNLVLRVEKPTSLLRVCIVEEDGDWWNFINTALFDADRWYLVTIPMRKMFPLEGFSIKGDGKQDLGRVAELRFLFDSTAIGASPAENTVTIDSVFLST